MKPRIARADALDDRPAVVAARLDAVELVPGVLPELGGPELPVCVPGQPLRVAVPHRVDERPGDRVVVGHVAGRRHAQDLAVQRVAGSCACRGSPRRRRSRRACRRARTRCGRRRGCRPWRARRARPRAVAVERGLVAERRCARCGCRRPWSRTRTATRCRRRRGRRARAARPRPRARRRARCRCLRGEAPSPSPDRAAAARPRRRRARSPGSVVPSSSGVGCAPSTTAPRARSRHRSESPPAARRRRSARSGGVGCAGSVCGCGRAPRRAAGALRRPHGDERGASDGGMPATLPVASANLEDGCARVGAKARQ